MIMEHTEQTEHTLVDIVPDHPAEDDPKLAAKLYNMFEFKQLEEPFGKAPNPFGDDPPTLLYNHQETVVRYFSPISGKRLGLIMPDPGLGKTAITVLLAEQAARKDSKALIFTQNQVMEQNFRENILKFVKNKYTTPVSEEAAATKGAHINDYYEFRTYDAFSSLLLNNFDSTTDTFIPGFLDQFHGRRIVMDESHHIRATRQSETSKKETKPKKIGKTQKPKITDQSLERVTGKGNANWMRGVRQSYRAFFLFLHSIQDCSIFLITATPMVDKKTEFCFQMNLILPIERLFIAPNSAFSDFMGLEGEELLKVVYKHCRGMISYSRAKYRAKRIDEGQRIEPHEVGGKTIEFVTKYVACPMRKEQYAVVTAIEKQEGGTAISDDPEAYGADEANLNSFKHRSRAASSMVFPFDGQYVAGNEEVIPPLPGQKKGTTAFDYYIQQAADKSWHLASASPKDRKRAKHIEELEKIMRDVKTSNGLEKLSSKYARIIRILNADKDDDRLVTYIYSPLLEGSGLIPLMVAMTLNGYKQYVPHGGDAVARLVEENEILRRSGKKIPRRIALISSGASSAEVREIKNIFNHQKNARGELIYVVVGSPSSGESISFHHVRREIIASPTWNDALLRQARGRGFRLDSHKTRDFADADAFVRVLILAATPPEDVIAEAEKKGEGVPLPTDIHILILAELKGRRNGGVYRAAKQVSFDGLINKKLNQRPDEPGISDETDYTTGTYDIVSGDIELTKDGKFIPIQPMEMNTKNYTLYYDRSRTRQREAVLKIFRTRTSITLDELSKELLYDRQSLLYALDSMIEDRTQIQDMFGYRRYLREKDNVYFLQPSYGDGDPYLEHYTKCVYVEVERDTAIHVEESAVELVKDCVLEANKDPTNADELFTSLYDIVREYVAILFEGYVDGTLKIVDDARDAFLKRLKTSVGVLKYEGGEETFYHKLYYLGEKRKAGDAAYGKGTDLKTAKELGKPSRLRVYDEDNGSWRFANYEEDEAIVNMVNTEITETREQMKIHYVYGVRFVVDGKLHLFFPDHEKTRVTKGAGKKKKESVKRKKESAKRKKKAVEEELSEEELAELPPNAPEKDKRYIAKIGKDASSENKTVLVDVLWKLSQITEDEPKYYHDDYNFDGITKEERDSMIADMQRAKAISEAKIGIKLAQMPDDQLYFFWWFRIHRKIANKNKNDPKKHTKTLVGLLEQRLERLGLIIDR